MLNQKVPNAVKDTLSKNKVETQQMLTSACAHLGEYTYNAHVNHTYTIIKQSIRCPTRMLRARRARRYSEQRSTLPSVLFDSVLHLAKPSMDIYKAVYWVWEMAQWQRTYSA